MLFYILKRIALMVPTLLGALTITFVVIQFVPGGPVEQMVAQFQSFEVGGGEGQVGMGGGGYRGRQGVDAARIETRKPDGTKRIVDLHPGQAIWSDANEHSWKLLAGEIDIVAVEVKAAEKPAEEAAPPAAAANRP